MNRPLVHKKQTHCPLLNGTPLRRRLGRPSIISQPLGKSSEEGNISSREPRRTNEPAPGSTCGNHAPMGGGYLCFTPHFSLFGRYDLELVTRLSSADRAENETSKQSSPPPPPGFQAQVPRVLSCVNASLPPEVKSPCSRA